MWGYPNFMGLGRAKIRKNMKCGQTSTFDWLFQSWMVISTTMEKKSHGFVEVFEKKRFWRGFLYFLNQLKWGRKMVFVLYMIGVCYLDSEQMFICGGRMRPLKNLDSLSKERTSVRYADSDYNFRDTVWYDGGAKSNSQIWIVGWRIWWLLGWSGGN
jgi:hypothetical protein